MLTTTATWGPGAGWSIEPSAISVRPGSTVALAFADGRADTGAALAHLRDTLPGTSLLACSTAGQILDAHVDPAPLVVAVVVFDHAHVVSAFLPVADQDAMAAGEALGGLLTERAGGQHIAGVMVLGGGLHINGSALVAGLTRSLPPSTALSGGLAGDGTHFEKTWVRCDDETGEDCVTGFAVLGDDVDFSHGSHGGWTGFGPTRTITRSDGHVLFELDGQPALLLYKQYLGDRAEELPSSALLFPLTISSPDGTTNLVRTILAVDETDQSMTFAGDVPEGWSARLMWTTMDRLTQGATDAAEDSAQPDSGLAVAISCVGRRLVLGERTDEELDSVVDVIGQHTPIVGFYSYGEIAPVAGMCALHNQTMTITTIRERAPG